MLKEKDVASEAHETAGEGRNEVFIQISCNDFQRNEDGSWVTVRQLDVYCRQGQRKLLDAGRRFNRGQLSIFGLDLAALLEEHCS